MCKNGLCRCNRRYNRFGGQNVLNRVVSDLFSDFTYTPSDVCGARISLHSRPAMTIIYSNAAVSCGYEKG